MPRRPLISPLFPYTTLFRSRQDAPHAHCIVADPSNRFALAADLGVDRVLVYRLDLDNKTLNHIENGDRKSTRLNSSHLVISYAVFCLKKKKIKKTQTNKVNL